MLVVEAARIAIKKFGTKITGKEMRWGLENLNLDEKRLAELGASGFGKPIKISCADHEGNGPVLFQEWNGSEWKIISDWVEPMSKTVRPMLEAAAVKEAKKWNYKMRENCN
jgi:branched-chain amino acid transport system substrate-binding protein